MTMTTIPESLNSPASGKAVFMEFGPPSQQMSPSSMSHGHYPMHCLHSAGHGQHDGYSPASSFPRSLAYPYVNSVGSHSTSPYLSTVQTYQNSSALTQTRLEEAGKSPAPAFGSCKIATFAVFVGAAPRRAQPSLHPKGDPDVGLRQKPRKTRWWKEERFGSTGRGRRSGSQGLSIPVYSSKRSTGGFSRRNIWRYRRERSSLPRWVSPRHR